MRLVYAFDISCSQLQPLTLPFTLPGVVGIGQDITGRLAQEREYTRLIDTANAPIFGVDTQGRVNVWNICARKLVGYSTAEVMGHSLVQEFITQDYQASVQAVLDQALAGVETANFEFPLITKAGARIEVLLNATTRRNEHGKVIGKASDVCDRRPLLNSWPFS